MLLLVYNNTAAMTAFLNIVSAGGLTDFFVIVSDCLLTSAQSVLGFVLVLFLNKNHIIA